MSNLSVDYNMTFSFNYYHSIQYINFLNNHIDTFLSSKYFIFKNEKNLNEFNFQSYHLLLNELKMLGWDASYLDMVSIFLNLCFY